MVDCRPGSGAPPHELTHTQSNGGAPSENHQNQKNINEEMMQQPPGPSGDMGAHGIASPASVRASTPATTNTMNTYTNAMHGGGGYPAPGPYVKSVVWCGGAPGPVGPMGSVGPVPGGPPPLHMGPPHVPPPPLGVNPHAFRSVQANGSDLPLNDIATLRYFYNLGIECMWAAYGMPVPPPQPPHQPHPAHQPHQPQPPHPPRHYSPRDLAQDMQQISLHERPVLPHVEQNHKNKPSEKPPMNAKGNGNGQRPLLGPRFKRGGNNSNNHHDGAQNSNQNKHSSNVGGNRPNHRRNSHNDGRNNGPHMGYNSGAGEGEVVMEQQPLITMPYIPYPPPMYPIQYYPVETDPAMMGMMSGMGYVGYEEAVEYGMQPTYYPPQPPHYPPPPPHPHQHQHQHHGEHK